MSDKAICKNSPKRLDRTTQYVRKRKPNRVDRKTTRWPLSNFIAVTGSSNGVKCKHVSELKERWLYVLFRVLYNVPMLLSCQLLRWAGLTTEAQHFPWHEPLRRQLCVDSGVATGKCGIHARS